MFIIVVFCLKSTRKKHDKFGFILLLLEVIFTGPKEPVKKK